jgi:hypothetical protein
MDLSGTPVRERIGHYLFPSTTNLFFTRLISPGQRLSHSLNNVFVPPSFLDDFLLKIPMNLTDGQWRLIEPILPPPSPPGRGRPPLCYPPGMLRDTARERGALPEMAR